MPRRRFAGADRPYLGESFRTGDWPIRALNRGSGSVFARRRRRSAPGGGHGHARATVHAGGHTRTARLPKGPRVRTLPYQRRVHRSGGSHRRLLGRLPTPIDRPLLGRPPCVGQASGGQRPTARRGWLKPPHDQPVRPRSHSCASRLCLPPVPIDPAHDVDVLMT